jgi:hypothetical protein
MQDAINAISHVNDQIDGVKNLIESTPVGHMRDLLKELLRSHYAALKIMSRSLYTSAQLRELSFERLPTDREKIEHLEQQIFQDSKILHRVIDDIDRTDARFIHDTIRHFKNPKFVRNQVTHE